jgi:hypothetical protein
MVRPPCRCRSGAAIHYLWVRSPRGTGARDERRRLPGTASGDTGSDGGAQGPDARLPAGSAVPARSPSVGVLRPGLAQPGIRSALASGLRHRSVRRRGWPRGRALHRARVRGGANARAVGWGREARPPRRGQCPLCGNDGGRAIAPLGNCTPQLGPVECPCRPRGGDEADRLRVGRAVRGRSVCSPAFPRSAAGGRCPRSLDSVQRPSAVATPGTFAEAVGICLRGAWAAEPVGVPDTSRDLC